MVFLVIEWHLHMSKKIYFGTSTYIWWFSWNIIWENPPDRYTSFSCMYCTRIVSKNRYFQPIKNSRIQTIILKLQIIFQDDKLILTLSTIILAINFPLQWEKSYLKEKIRTFNETGIVNFVKIILYLSYVKQYKISKFIP